MQWFDVMSIMWKQAYASYETDRAACPVCGSRDASQYAEQFGLGLVVCRTCGLCYVSPRVKHPDLNYHGSLDRTAEKYSAVFAGIALHPRWENYLEHLRVLERFRGGGSLLDVGTHCGFFLRYARDAGWRVLGVEPSPANSELAREKFGLPVITGYLQDAHLDGEMFDVVTVIDVLEHVTEPRPLILEIQRVLRLGGVLFIKVPNLGWNLLKYWTLGKVLRRSHYDFFDIREHVVQYNVASLGHLLLGCGFAPISWHVPRPVQVGSPWQRWTRTLAYFIGKGIFAVTGHFSVLATDIAVIARKS